MCLASVFDRVFTRSVFNENILFESVFYGSPVKCFFIEHYK